MTKILKNVSLGKASFILEDKKKQHLFSVDSKCHKVLLTFFDITGKLFIHQKNVKLGYCQFQYRSSSGQPTIIKVILSVTL